LAKGETLRDFLLKVTAFRCGGLVTLLSLALFLMPLSHWERFLVSLDSAVIDLMFSVRGPMRASGEVVIVDIDEKSLADQNLGQWPWPRNKVAALVQSIADSEPKVIGLDLLFAEPDRTSPARYKNVLQKFAGHEIAEDELVPLDHDEVLGHVVSDAGCVLGYVLQPYDDGMSVGEMRPFYEASVKFEPQGALPLLSRAHRPIMNCETIENYVRTEGFVNTGLDNKGTVRSVEGFMEFDGVFYPSLALEVSRIGLGADEYVLHLSQNEIFGSDGRRQVLGVSLGERMIPTTFSGGIAINFRGTAKTQFPYYSAKDVIEGTIQTNALRDKYVLVGTSAYGLGDLRATPFSKECPGVEIHANIIDNILLGDPIHTNQGENLSIGVTVILVGGLLLSFILSRSGALIGALTALLFFVLIIGGSYQFGFLHGNILNIAHSVLSLMAVFLVTMIVNYFTETKKKQFITNALGHYVSPAIAHRLILEPERLDLGGHDRELTIMFSDIRGFTTISEALGARQMSEFLNEYLTAMTDIVMESDGTLDKFIGDALMAFWGDPIDNPQHAPDAVRSAMVQMKTLRELQPVWKARGIPDIDIGIGLNTGVVSVGNMGSKSRFDYTVIGDSVNLASRLEGLNKEYGTHIIISEFTLAKLPEQGAYRILDMVRVKGKKEPVRIYEPLELDNPSEEQRRRANDFAEFFHLYQSRDFFEAQKKLSEIQYGLPEKLFSLYESRLEEFGKMPPADDWDGTYTFTHK